MQNYLPQMIGMESANCVRKGRNVYEGIQRGWGIEFGDLRKEIEADPLFQEARMVAGGESIMALDRTYNIFLIMKYFFDKLPVGDIIEFGSYRCGNAIFMACLCDRLYPGRKIYALDSFQGMPRTDKSVDAHSEGDFQNAVYEEVSKQVSATGLKNIMLIKGLFEETAPNLPV